MMDQEVGEQNLHTQLGNAVAVDKIVFFLFLFSDLCVEDNGNDPPREDALQNISADDLPDSASQTAQQHDSKFSFRLHAQHPATS